MRREATGEGAAHTVERVRGPGGRLRRIALWVVQALLAAAMVGAGIAKLSGAAEMVALFDAVGVGQWFRVATGALEVGGGVLLLVPSVAGVAALVLAGVLSGAILTELFVLPDGSVLKPLPFLLLALVVGYGRRHSVVRLLGRSGRAN